MIKLTPEEQEYWDKKYDEFVKEKIKEAEEDIKCGRLYTEEKFKEKIREFDEQLRRENLLKSKETRLNTQNNTTEMYKRFIRA